MATIEHASALPRASLRVISALCGFSIPVQVSIRSLIQPAASLGGLESLIEHSQGLTRAPVLAWLDGRRCGATQGLCCAGDLRCADPEC